MSTVLAESPIFSTLPETMPLKRYGYQIVRHGGLPEQYLELKRAFAERLRKKLSVFSGKDIPAFECERYHEVLDREAIDHHAFIKATTRRLPPELIADPYLAGLIEAAGVHVGKRLRAYNSALEFRVVRPHCPDNNPWHRDHWFPYFAPLLNVYLPLSGSYCDSSLQIIPFSHLWTDQECVPTFGYGEAKTNKGGVLYSVPEIRTCTHEMKGHRMDVIPGDFTLFSPRMVHGEGSNSSLETRFSMEFRLEVVP